MKFSFTKNPESDFFYKEPKANKQKNILALGGVRISDFSFSKESEKVKKNGEGSNK